MNKGKKVILLILLALLLLIAIVYFSRMRDFEYDTYVMKITKGMGTVHEVSLYIYDDYNARVVTTVGGVASDESSGTKITTLKSFNLDYLITYLENNEFPLEVENYEVEVKERFTKIVNLTDQIISEVFTKATHIPIIEE